MPSEFSTKVKEGMKPYREGTDKSKLKQAEAKQTALSGAIAGLSTSPTARQQKKVDRNKKRVEGLKSSSPANPAIKPKVINPEGDKGDATDTKLGDKRKKPIGPPVKHKVDKHKVYGQTHEDRVRARREKNHLPMADWTQ